jgi:hypothetical protein
MIILIIMSPIHKCYWAMSVYFPRKSTCEPLVKIIEWICMLRYLEKLWDKVNKLQTCLCALKSSVHNPAARCAAVDGVTYENPLSAQVSAY